jgi:hypothetical protein
MQVKELSVTLRPRLMAESGDLGVAIVQQHWQSIWRCYFPVWGGVALLALALNFVNLWAPTLFLLWMKPWLDRTLLFVLSRAVFNQSTDWRTLWRNRKDVWFRSPLSSLLWLRFSPWRAYVLPLVQLEGQKGQSFRQRRSQILRGHRGAAFGMHWAFANVELVLHLGAMALLLWFAPRGSGKDIFVWFTETNGRIGPDLLANTLYAGVILVVEPFYVAAGFAMYLNRRVELEAWDVEQEFRRAFSH